MTATIHDTVNGDRLTAANAARARRAAERAALDVARRVQHLDDRWLGALAERVAVEQQRRSEIRHRAADFATGDPNGQFASGGVR